MNKILLLLLVLGSGAVSAQRILNQRAEAQGEKIVITYDITGLSGDSFDIAIYSSHNNFAAALVQVAGDVGKGIHAGNGKRIEWNAKSELTPNFKGQLKFEIRAVVIAKLGITNPPASARRGKDLTVNWRGGQPNQRVKIELMRAGAVLSTSSNTGNTGTQSWTLPSDLAVAKDYQLRLSDGKETVTTGNFPVNRKVPLLVKAIPVVAVGVVAVLLLGGKSTPPDDNVAAPPDLGLD